MSDTGQLSMKCTAKKKNEITTDTHNNKTIEREMFDAFIYLMVEI